MSLYSKPMSGRYTGGVCVILQSMRGQLVACERVCVWSASRRFKQDFPVPAKFILSLWGERKLTHQSCEQELLRSRDPGMLRAMEVVNTVRSREEQAEEAILRKRRRASSSMDDDSQT